MKTLGELFNEDSDGFINPIQTPEQIKHSKYLRSIRRTDSVDTLEDITARYKELESNIYHTDPSSDEYQDMIDDLEMLSDLMYDMQTSGE